jgi:hypothetical protein
LYDRVFEVERYRTRYAGYLDLLARRWFTYENVSALSGQYHELIAPYVAQSTGDKMFVGEAAMFPLEAFYNSSGGYGRFARQRSAFIISTLETGD